MVSSRLIVIIVIIVVVVVVVIIAIRYSEHVRKVLIPKISERTEIGLWDLNIWDLNIWN